MAIPIETRKKIFSAMERGESIASIARRFELTQQGIHQLRRTVRARGTLAPGKTGPQGHVKLTDADLWLMREQVAANPGITLLELRDMLSVQVAESTVSRALKKMDISFKKSR